MNMKENIVKGKIIHFTGQFELRPQYRAEQLGATIVEFDVRGCRLARVGTGSQLHYSRTGAEFSV